MKWYSNMIGKEIQGVIYAIENINNEVKPNEINIGKDIVITV